MYCTDVLYRYNVILTLDGWDTLGCLGTPVSQLTSVGGINRQNLLRDFSTASFTEQATSNIFNNEAMSSPNKISLKILEKLESPWLLCSTENAELKIVKDINGKLAKVDAAGSTLILFRPETLEMSTCQYLQSEMVTHLPLSLIFPTEDVNQEAIEMMKKDFMKEFGDANLLSLKTTDQHVVFIVLKMFPAKSTNKYDYKVPMKIADQDGNIVMMDIFTDAWRFEEGGIYRVTGLQREPGVAQFRATDKTEVQELSEEDAGAMTFPKLGEEEIKGKLLFTFDVSHQEICRAHRHPANTCVYCKKIPQWMTPTTWVISATCLIQLAASHGYAEEKKIHLDGLSLLGRKPGKIVSFIEGIHSAANRKEGKTVKIQFDTVEGQSYASKMEIVEDEEV